MTNILFVCHGNICRSPMAEFLFKDMVKEKHEESFYHIESAAVSSEETGNPVYPPVRQLLAEKGISCKGKTARKITREDYYDFDCIIAMDRSNLRYLERILPSADKTYLLLSFAGMDRDVADPWYTGDFDACYKDIMTGLEGLWMHLGKA